jgi:hypothetical protein
VSVEEANEEIHQRCWNGLGTGALTDSSWEIAAVAVPLFLVERSCLVQGEVVVYSQSTLMEHHFEQRVEGQSTKWASLLHNLVGSLH